MQVVNLAVKKIASVDRKFVSCDLCRSEINYSSPVSVRKIDILNATVLKISKTMQGLGH